MWDSSVCVWVILWANRDYSASKCIDYHIVCNDVFAFPVVVVALFVYAHIPGKKKRKKKVRSLCIESANKNTEKKEEKEIV